MLNAPTDPRDDERFRASTLFHQGRKRYAVKDYPGALRLYRLAIGPLTKLAQRAPNDERLQFELARIRFAMGLLFIETRAEFRQTIEMLESAVSILEPLVAPSPDNYSYRERMGTVCEKLGVVYRSRDLARSEHWFRQAVEHRSHFERLHSGGIGMTPNRVQLQWSLWALMGVLVQSGATEQAIETGLQAELISQSLPDGGGSITSQRERLEALLRAAGRDAEADAVWHRADTRRAPQ